MNPLRRPSSALAAVLAILGFFAPGQLTVAADPLPEPYIPAPCGVNLKTHNFTNEVLDEAQALGFRAIRRGIYWKAVEKEKGVYDFSAYDAQFEHAKKLGLVVVGVFFSNNKLYGSNGKGGVRTEEGRRGFAKFAAATAAHYKGYPILWEIWNEPNTMTFWGKHGKGNTDQYAEEYTALVRETTPAILEADPDAFVMAGSVSNYWSKSYEWTEFAFKRGILKTGIKGWSVHPYGMKTPEEFVEGHKITRDLMKKYGGPELPLLNTERGFSIGKTVGGAEPDEGWAGGSIERALEFQSWHIVRQFLLELLQDVRLTIWYEWDGDKFGLFDKKGPRPVQKAAAVMFKQLDGYKVAGRLPSDSELDFVLLMENKTGGQKLVAWTAPQAGSPPDTAVDHSVKIEVSSPSGFEGTLDIVDLMGKPQKAKVDGGGIELALSGAPQYLTLPDGMKLGSVQAQP